MYAIRSYYGLADDKIVFDTIELQEKPSLFPEVKVDMGLKELTEGMMLRNVITSYSIHYTKLYDARNPWPGPGFPQSPRRAPRSYCCNRYAQRRCCIRKWCAGKSIQRYQDWGHDHHRVS